jgi:hypothetical protein
MWSLVHAQHPGNKYYTELLNEISDVPETTTTLNTSATAGTGATTTTATAATATSNDSTTATSSTTTPDVPEVVDNSTPRAKAATVVDHIMKEKDGRFLQLVMGSVAAGNLHEPSRRCKIMARNDAIQKVSQELMWLKYKKQTAAKHLLAKEAQLKEQQELQKELKKKQVRIAKAAATALIVASERAAAQRAAEKAAAKAAEAAAKKEAAVAAAAAVDVFNAQIALDGPLKLPARRPPSYTRHVPVGMLLPAQQRPSKPKARIKTASELSMKPGQLSGSYLQGQAPSTESSESDGSGVAASAAAAAAAAAATVSGAMAPPPNQQQVRQLHEPPAIVHKSIPRNMPPPAPQQYNQHHQQQQRRYGHGDHHHQNQSQQRYRQQQQQSAASAAAAASHQQPKQPPQQQPKAQQPWLRVHQEQIEENIPKDASCVVHIFDRRVNLDSHPADASMYSLLRSWAQDDPYRKIQVPIVSTIASKTTTVTPDHGDNGSSKTTGKRSADAMLVTFTTTTTDTTTRPPRTLNVMLDIGMLDAGVMDTEQSSNNNDTTNYAPPSNLLRQFVGKAKRVKRRKMGVHKARMATALISLERRGIHLSK